MGLLKPSSSPLVVWIVLDACRYDVFWETPTLMRDMAARGLRLSQCISQGAWTFASFSAFLTGRHSTRNGTSVLAPPEAPRTKRSLFRIDLLQFDPDAPTVFRLFRSAGYDLLSRGVPIFGFDYDYSPWSFFPFSKLDSRAVCCWLNQRASVPALYFFHTPVTRFSRGLDRASLGNWRQGTFVAQMERAPFVEDQRMRSFATSALQRIDETEFQPLVRELERSGRLAHTTFVIHADHGETFGEFLARRENYDVDLCGLSIWHHNCWEETLRVPAAVFGAGAPGRERSELSCLIDLLPTVAAIHGVPTAADLDGVDLLSPTGRAADRRAFFEGHHEKTVGVRTAREKLVYNLDRRQSLLFDLAADPGETSPLVGAPDDHPLWTALTAYAGREVRGASTAEQAAIHQRLKDLGYVE